MNAKTWPLFWCVATLFSCILFHSFVDLKPQVEENFFFSSDDPQFQADKNISKIFPQPPQIILSAKGALTSEAYQKKIAELTARLMALPEVVEVQSLSRGPRDVKSALESPLWRRGLISDDRRSSFVSVLIKDVKIEEAVLNVEKIKADLNVSGQFELAISGAPYIVEIIRRNLLRDLKVFSIVAFLVFAAAIWVLFRSLTILAGTLLSCLNVSMLTLTISEMLHIKIGPLTSNLSVIVFVLALTHIIFITFNWKYVLETGVPGEPSAEAVKMTLHPSFWSMITQLLGFMSLFFVKATPLRQLGVSGILGTLIAFAAAYSIYPSFLKYESLRLKKSAKPSAAKIKKLPFFRTPHRRTAIGLLALSLLAGIGIFNLNTDPSLLSFFKKDSELRTGLEYIDHNGGSTPLKLVVEDAGGARLDTNAAYDKLWVLHKALEQDDSVGNVISLPIVLAEAKTNPLGHIIPIDWLVNLLASPVFGKVTEYFITPDRKRTLFLLRMKEAGREWPRLKIVAHVEEIVKAKGFKPVMTGGVYMLQGKLSELVVSSILEGLFLLVLIFAFIGGFISRSVRVGAAIFASLCMIPLGAIGILGYFHVPFDVISSPGANIAIGIGVDSMINMLFYMKRRPDWSYACSHLWKPILCSTVLTCLGFGIFVLSAFPPTQRFGLSVILGTLITPLAALFVFPWIAGKRA